MLALSALAALSASIFSASAAVEADGGAPNLAYVAGAGAHGQNLAIIDINQRKQTRSVALGGTPIAVVLSADSRLAFVIEQARNEVVVLNTQTLGVVTRIAVGQDPSALAFDVGQSLLYVTNAGANTVTVIDPNALRVIAVIPVGSDPTAVAVAAANSGIQDTYDEEIYVTNTGSDTVSVISVTAKRVIATISVPDGPHAVVIPSTGGIAYVATQSGAVLALSLSGRRLLGTLWQAPGAQLGTMDYDAVTGVIYVPDASSNRVVALAPATDSGASPATFPTEPLRTLPFPGMPVAVAITFEGSFGFVAERHSGQVMIFDATTRQNLGTVDVGGSPRAIVTGAYPPLLNNQQSFLADALVIGLIALVMGAALISTIIVSRQQARRRVKGRIS